MNKCVYDDEVRIAKQNRIKFRRLLSGQYRRKNSTDEEHQLRKEMIKQKLINEFGINPENIHETYQGNIFVNRFYHG